MSGRLLQLQEARLDAVQAIDRSRLAAGLERIATSIRRGELLCDAHAYACVLIGKDDIEVTWDSATVLTWSELDQADHALGAAIKGARRGGDIKEAIETDRQMREQIRQKETDRVAAVYAEHPWVCDHCRRRFKTCRGANSHERRCWKNPGTKP